MAYLLGVDLGTSSVKTVLMDHHGKLAAICQQEYTFDIPREGWAEQDPVVWWQAAVATIRGALAQAAVSPDDIDGVGFSGQMHGLVPLDRQDQPVRKVIIWCDARSVDEVEDIRRLLGNERLGEITCNQIAAGFQTASLLWMKKHEPALYEKTETVLLPKDYLRYRLTGCLSTDVTDAAGTLALNVRQAAWSDELIRTLGLRRSLYPKIYLPQDFAGEVTAAASAETGLKAGTKVFHGGADQVMQAIGNGIIAPGQVSVTIGTGAQVFAPIASAIYDKQLRAHTFNNFQQDSWYFMGATLCGGLSLRWLRDTVLGGMPYREMDTQVEAVPRGSDGLIYLPYLSGERTPHMDPLARGMFFGLTLKHSRAHLMRAVMEGVVFSLRDCLELYEQLGQSCRRVIASGGGARSAPWLQMQADIFGKEVYTSKMLEQAGVGAAICAGVGAGVYESWQQACDTVIRWNDTPAVPDLKGTARYAEYRELFRALYQSNRELMHRCTALSRQEK